MAAVAGVKITLKRNLVADTEPKAGDLEQGELALNVADGVIFMKTVADGAEDVKKFFPSSWIPIAGTWDITYKGRYVGIGIDAPTATLDVVNSNIEEMAIVSCRSTAGDGGAKFLLYECASEAAWSAKLDKSGFLKIFDEVAGVNIVVIEQKACSDAIHINSKGRIGLGLSENIDSKLTFPEDTGAIGGILFGKDTNLYRAAADKLMTDDLMSAERFKVNNLNTAPASSTALGAIGEIRITSDYIYVCVGINAWKRAALSTW